MSPPHYISVAMTELMTFAEVCKELKRTQVTIRNLQTGLDMYIPRDPERYSPSYHAFLFKVVALRMLNIPVDDIRDLFIREKRILEMLHADTLTDSPTWYLDQCDMNGKSESRLFLTGYDLGVPVHSGRMQPHLNFDGRKRELFSGPDMGENIREFCDTYCRHLEKLKSRIQSEKLVLRQALAWADRVC